MSIIQINDQELVRRLTQAASHLSDPRDLGHALANSLLTVTEDNFDQEGRPAWAGLRPVTVARRKAGKILYQSGQLRRSITSSVTSDEVMIGTNDPKAATHQFGAQQGQYGKTRRNGPIPWGNIPARPFLPMDQHGTLQHEAERAIYDDVDHFYQKLFG